MRAPAPPLPAGPLTPARNLHDLCTLFASALVVGKPADDPDAARGTALAESLALFFIAAGMVERQKDPAVLLVPVSVPLSAVRVADFRFVAVREEVAS